MRVSSNVILRTTEPSWPRLGRSGGLTVSQTNIRDNGIHLACLPGMKILTAALCVFDVMIVAYDLQQIASWASLWT